MRYDKRIGKKGWESSKSNVNVKRRFNCRNLHFFPSSFSQTKVDSSTIVFCFPIKGSHQPKQKKSKKSKPQHGIWNQYSNIPYKTHIVLCSKVWRKKKQKNFKKFSSQIRSLVVQRYFFGKHMVTTCRIESITEFLNIFVHKQPFEYSCCYFVENASFMHS